MRFGVEPAQLQKAVPVIASIFIILGVAFLRERSRTLAAILATMPINIPLGLWVLFGTGDYDPRAAALFVRALLPGLLATMVWVGAVWAALRLGWELLPAVVGGYGVWAVLVVVFIALGWLHVR
ncbi:MAG: hypothetical protein NZL91_09935 [Thermoflexales bacterium]|nr:hypothetical protein [Thermoflexales bacterium]MCS7324127.1 hypothetical protein [Thermoflexales bacterium]MCX7939637.1 hypothetical protein [Thermoflexales bacterium]MDW8054337.1 hypothetical protein [Anaerolineae bacterium]MDW8291501.1 hypothetical protein [Anaerolineae bacterium]